MALPYVVHMVAGGLAIVLGFITLFAAKGAPLHSRIGKGFVVAMLTLAMTGVGMAAWHGDIGTMMGGSLALYLVSTGMITVQQATIPWRRALIAAALFGIAIAVVSLVRLVMMFPRTGAGSGYLLIAGAALAAVRGDVRILHHGALTGTRRLTRHLWRMCMALWIATVSFFLGPRERVERILPDAMVTTPVIMIPVLTVLVVMGYWIWRLRTRAPLRGPSLAASNVPGPAEPTSRSPVHPGRLTWRS